MRRTSALVTATALVLLAGCQGGGEYGAVAAPTTEEAPPVAVQVSPADGAVDVSPGCRWRSPSRTAS